MTCLHNTLLVQSTTQICTQSPKYDMGYQVMKSNFGRLVARNLWVMDYYERYGLRGRELTASAGDCTIGTDGL